MSTGGADRRVIVEMKDARLTWDYGGRALSASLSIYGGDLVLIYSDQPDAATLFADSCVGLADPGRGSVSFLGRDWRGISDDLAGWLRGWIGRVFVRGNWLEHMSLLDNIMLPQLHRTHRPVNVVRDEAARLALELGLPGVPTGPPGDYPPPDLQRAACVRAFLGRPALVLLENPTYRAYPEIVPPLVNIIRRARSRGAGVVWLTREERVWVDRTVPASQRYRILGHELQSVSVSER